MTPKEALALLKNRTASLALNHKIGSRDIAKLEIKEIVMAIEIHVIPTLENLVVKHEALKRDVARFIELAYKEDKDYMELAEFYALKEKLSKVGKE